MSSNFDLPGHLACGYPPHICLWGRPRDMRDWKRGMKTQSKVLTVSHAPHTLSFKAGEQRQPPREGRRWRRPAGVPAVPTPASAPGRGLQCKKTAPSNVGAVATAGRGSCAGGRPAKSQPGERRVTLGACLLGVILVRTENGRSEPRWHDMVPRTGTGHGQGVEGLVVLKGPGEILQPSLLTPKHRGSPRVQPRGGFMTE